MGAGMLTKRLRWLAVVAVFVLVAGGVTLWVVMPPRTDERVKVGMSESEVQGLPAKCVYLSVVDHIGTAEYCYTCPDGSLRVRYGDGGRVARFEFTPTPFWERLRKRLGW
jgi:hypothetical protein